MNKMNKKGFTLIEMMAVIAIVAVLVSLIIPTVLGSTDKAAAATNAANLRSVEGEVVTLMLTNPSLFGDQAGKREELEGNIQEEEELQRSADELRTEIAAKQEDQAALKEDIEDLNSVLDAAESAAKKLGLANPDAWTYENIETSYQAEKKSHGTCGWGCKILGCTVDLKKEAKTEYVKVKTQLEDTEGTLAIVNRELDELEEELRQIEEDSQGREDGYRNELAGLGFFIAENGYITLEDGTKIECPVSQKVDTDSVSIGKGQQMVVYVDNVNYQAYACYVSEADIEYFTGDFSAVAED